MIIKNTGSYVVIVNGKYAYCFGELMNDFNRATLYTKEEAFKIAKLFHDENPKRSISVNEVLLELRKGSSDLLDEAG